LEPQPLRSELLHSAYLEEVMVGAASVRIEPTRRFLECIEVIALDDAIDDRTVDV